MISQAGTAVPQGGLLGIGNAGIADEGVIEGAFDAADPLAVVSPTVFLPGEPGGGAYEKLDALYKSGLYSTPNIFAPPAERRPHVLRLELRTGCERNRCTYCDGYKRVRYREKSIEEFEAHVRHVLEFMLGGAKRWWLPRLFFSDDLPFRRIFIGGGSAMGVSTKKLIQALNISTAYFGMATGYSPTRVASYAYTTDILGKSVAELRALRQAGLSLVYWGWESGSDEVLRYVNKDCTADQIVKGAIKLYDATIGTSATVMPGLGGKRLSSEHVRGTIDLLNHVSPRYLTFMGTNPAPSSIYAKRMEAEMREGTNRPLTDSEIAEQIVAILEGLKRFPFKIASFPPEIDRIGHNPLLFDDGIKIFGHGFIEPSAETGRRILMKLRLRTAIMGRPSGEIPGAMALAITRELHEQLNVAPVYEEMGYDPFGYNPELTDYLLKWLEALGSHAAVALPQLTELLARVESGKFETLFEPHTYTARYRSRLINVIQSLKLKTAKTPDADTIRRTIPHDKKYVPDFKELFLRTIENK